MGSQATSGGSGQHDCRHGELLLRQLRDDDVDAAIEAGLMQYVPCPTCDPVLAAQLIEAQQRLSKAWAARDRYRARNERLARRAAEREAKRASVAPAEKKSTLPPAAAAILARAIAKASERGKR